MAATEKQWVDFILEGPTAMEPPTDGDYSDFANGFRMLPGETLAGILADYEQVAARTDELVRTLPDLDLSHELAAGALVPARRALDAPGACSCTSWPKPPSTPATPTSSARPWTARSPWADPSALGTHRFRDR